MGIKFNYKNNVYKIFGYADNLNPFQIDTIKNIFKKKFVFTIPFDSTANNSLYPPNSSKVRSCISSDSTSLTYISNYTIIKLTVIQQ